MRFLRGVNIADISEISNNLAKKTGFIIVISSKRVTLRQQSALVAQRIEQLPSKQWVVGSIPSRGAIFLRCKKHEAVGFACLSAVASAKVECRGNGAS